FWPHCGQITLFFSLLLLPHAPHSTLFPYTTLFRSLRNERRVPPNKPDSFSISTSEQLVEDFDKVAAMVALVIVVLSSIGLLVGGDRKSTRLNSSHVSISYAVFCLKKKNIHIYYTLDEEEDYSQCLQQP